MIDNARDLLSSGFTETSSPSIYHYSGCRQPVFVHHGFACLTDDSQVYYSEYTYTLYTHETVVLC